MFVKSLIAATLAGLASAAPLVARQETIDTVGIIAIHSTSPIHLSAVSENGLKFWVRKETATYCPTVVEQCPTGNTTQLVLSASSETVSLNTVVPGGQQAYIASDGSLSATQAHSGNIGTGTRTPFEYTPQAGPGRVGVVQFNNTEFTACPSAEDANVYQVFALGYSGYVAGEACINIALGTAIVESTPVWQYI
ncbi:hypothetical protein HYFRA_00013497 [Hymenoscyphus fraxineus]|uniref:Uncharacterized protein n=1 Tax=Hymenoscyphus fraxineus TaxID=746836 RepID=A0A9N9PNB8_9HELO|nr:hypothetical protein HYFRA_00013497 [Hymenoscyphus fraxineus]